MSAGILRTCLKTALPKSTRGWLRNAYYAVLERYFYHFGGIRRTSVRGLEIFVGIQSRIESYRAETYASKEPDTLDWLDLWLAKKDSKVFYDIGANIGLYSLYAAKKNPGLMIFGFEPHPQNFANLCKNIRFNSFQNVFPCNFAMGKNLQFTSFNISDLAAGSAYSTLLALDSKAVDAGYDKPAKQSLLCVGLDQLVYELGAPAPQIIKIDVDGAEELIIDGAEKLLRSGAVRTLLIELNSIAKKRSSLEQKILSFGFKVASRGNRSELASGEISENVIFDSLKSS